MGVPQRTFGLGGMPLQFAAKSFAPEVQGVTMVGWNHRFGGGYTHLAMVPETHAMHQPAKTKSTSCVVEEPPNASARTARMTPHTRKQAMEYAQ